MRTGERTELSSLVESTYLETWEKISYPLTQITFIYLFIYLLTYLLRYIPKICWTKCNFMLYFVVPWRYRIKNGRKTEKTTKASDYSTDSLHSSPSLCRHVITEGTAYYLQMKRPCLCLLQGLRDFHVFVYPAVARTMGPV